MFINIIRYIVKCVPLTITSIKAWMSDTNLLPSSLQHHQQLPSSSTVNSTPLITFLNHSLHFLPSVYFTGLWMRHSQAHQLVSLMFGSGQLGDMSEREDVCKRERARQKETLRRVHHQWPPLTDWDAASRRSGSLTTIFPGPSLPHARPHYHLHLHHRLTQRSYYYIKEPKCTIG